MSKETPPERPQLLKTLIKMPAVHVYLGIVEMAQVGVNSAEVATPSCYAVIRAF